MNTHCGDGTAMTDGLQLTLAMEPHSGDGEAAMDDEMVDALVSALIADLNSIESVRAEQARAEAPEGSKAVGAFLLGVLQAEVSVANALKVARFLKARLLDGSPQPPIRLKLARTNADGSVTAVELEGAAADQEAMETLLSRLEASVEKLGRTS
jgi:hypothetical protein